MIRCPYKLKVSYAVMHQTYLEDLYERPKKEKEVNPLKKKKKIVGTSGRKDEQSCNDYCPKSTHKIKK